MCGKIKSKSGGTNARGTRSPTYHPYSPRGRPGRLNSILSRASTLEAREKEATVRTFIKNHVTKYLESCVENKEKLAVGKTLKGMFVSGCVNTSDTGRGVLFWHPQMYILSGVDVPLIWNNDKPDDVAERLDFELGRVLNVIATVNYTLHRLLKKKIDECFDVEEM